MQFEKKKADGTKGEELIFDRLRAKGWQVADVRNHEYFQRIDVDAVITKLSQCFMIDVKTDAHTSGNFYIEIEKETTERPGRIYTTRADLWFYYFTPLDTLYAFRPVAMAQHVELGQFHTARAPTRNGGYLSWSVGKLVPIHGAPITQTIENVSDF